MYDWDQEITHWLQGGTCFNCKLFSLIQTSDIANRARLRKCFPDEVAALESWERSGFTPEGRRSTCEKSEG